MAFPLKTQDVVSELKKLNKNYITDEQFRKSYQESVNVLNPVYGQVAFEEQQAMANLDYDYAQAVSDAYIASMQNVPAIQSSALGQGYKAQLMQQNQADLQDAYNQYKQNYLSNAQSVANTYGELKGDVRAQYDEMTQAIYDTYLSQEKAFTEEADIVRDYYDAHYGYLEYLYENEPEAFNTEALRHFVDDKGLLSKYDIFTLTDENTLSEDALKAISTISSKTDGISFTDYLDKTNPELLSWAATRTTDYDGMTNEALFKKAFGMTDEDIEQSYYGGQYAKEDYRVANMYRQFDNSETGGYATITKSDIAYDTYLDDESINALEGKKWKLSTSQNDSYSPEAFANAGKQLTKGDAGNYGDKKGSVVRQAVQDAKEGKLKEGTIIDINYGGGETFFIYKGGQFIKLVAEPKVSTTKILRDIGKIRKAELGGWGYKVDEWASNLFK